MLLIANRGDIIEIEDLKLISSIKNEQKSVSSKTSNVLIHNNKNIKVKNLNQLKYLETIENSTIKKPLSLEDIGKSSVYLMSDLSKGVTGEILYVDNGYNNVGMSIEDL